MSQGPTQQQLILDKVQYWWSDGVVSESAAELLRQHGVQVTAQRLAIMRVVAEHPHATADELGVPFLGEVPIDAAVPLSGDEGQPIVARAPDSPAAEAGLRRRGAATAPRLRARARATLR